MYNSVRPYYVSDDDLRVVKHHLTTHNQNLHISTLKGFSRLQPHYRFSED